MMKFSKLSLAGISLLASSICICAASDMSRDVNPGKKRSVTNKQAARAASQRIRANRAKMMASKRKAMKPAAAKGKTMMKPVMKGKTMMKGKSMMKPAMKSKAMQRRHMAKMKKAGMMKSGKMVDRKMAARDSAKLRKMELKADSKNRMMPAMKSKAMQRRHMAMMNKKPSTAISRMKSKAMRRRSMSKAQEKDMMLYSKQKMKSKAMMRREKSMNASLLDGNYGFGSAVTTESAVSYDAPGKIAGLQCGFYLTGAGLNERYKTDGYVGYLNQIDTLDDAGNTIKRARGGAAAKVDNAFGNVFLGLGGDLRYVHRLGSTMCMGVALHGCYGGGKDTFRVGNATITAPDTAGIHAAAADADDSGANAEAGVTAAAAAVLTHLQDAYTSAGFLDEHKNFGLDYTLRRDFGWGMQFNLGAQLGNTYIYALSELNFNRYTLTRNLTDFAKYTSSATVGNEVLATTAPVEVSHKLEIKEWLMSPSVGVGVSCGSRNAVVTFEGFYEFVREWKINSTKYSAEHQSFTTDYDTDHVDHVFVNPATSLKGGHFGMRIRFAFNFMPH